jgi:hypothetical protein
MPASSFWGNFKRRDSSKAAGKPDEVVAGPQSADWPGPAGAAGVGAPRRAAPLQQSTCW